MTLHVERRDGLLGSGLGGGRLVVGRVLRSCHGCPHDEDDEGDDQDGDPDERCLGTRKLFVREKLVVDAVGHGATSSSGSRRACREERYSTC